MKKGDPIICDYIGEDRYTGIVLDTDSDPAMYYAVAKLNKTKNKYKLYHLPRFASRKASTSDLYKFFDVVLNDSTLSGEIFGRKDFKKTLVGTVLDVVEYIPSYVCKRDNVIRDIIRVRTSVGILKFCCEGCGINFPNINGYKIPKDRTIRVGSKVRCINNKKTRLSINEIVEVSNIKNNNNNNIKNCVITVVDSTGKEHTSYVKNFKVL